MAAPRRPTLYSLAPSGRRRRRRVGVRTVAAVAGAVVLAGALVYALSVVVPLADRDAGVVTVPADAGGAPVDGDAPPGDPAIRPLDAGEAATRPIRGVDAAAAILVDPESGEVLWMHRPHARRAIASLTKLMTARLTADPDDLDQKVRLTQDVTGVPGENLDLEPGRRMTVRDLLGATLVASANDASVALAVHRSGTVGKFVRLMNREARRLKLSDTRYSNPSGIYDTGNHSSAWDVADLARAVLADRFLRRLVASRTYRPEAGAVYVNTNRLLWLYTGAVGVKTGFTDASGPSVAAAAKRRGTTLVAVVLDARGDEFDAAGRLLDWGFRRLR